MSKNQLLTMFGFHILFFFHDKETVEDTGSEGPDIEKSTRRRRRYTKPLWSVVNPDENFYFYWLMVLTICVLYNLWTLIVRQSFPELQVKKQKQQSTLVNNLYVHVFCCSIKNK